MPKKSNPPNRGGTGPHTRSQPKGKGPITGNRPSVAKGPVRPWSLGKGGSNKSMNFGKDVKKS